MALYSLITLCSEQFNCEPLYSEEQGKPQTKPEGGGSLKPSHLRNRFESPFKKNPLHSTVQNCFHLVIFLSS